MFKLKVLSLLMFLVILISLFPVTGKAQEYDDQGVPTTEYIKKFMEENPDLAVEMIKKLYVIEHSTPTLEIPKLDIILNKKGDLTVGFPKDAKGDLDIGFPPYNLSYDFKLNPYVTYGFKDKTIKTKHIVAGGIVVFGLGILSGVLLGK